MRGLAPNLVRPARTSREPDLASVECTRRHRVALIQAFFTRWRLRSIARCEYDTPMTNERRLADGRVELVDMRRVEASPLYNHDLAPVPLSRRNWTTYNYAALWVSMAHCIPTYMLASGLMASGMNWSQALITILLGNTIVLIPILLNSHPGTKYGIPFPVFARAAYGALGSNVPALMRALVACGWFGIQAWIGGGALHTMVKKNLPRWEQHLGAGLGGHTNAQRPSLVAFLWL